MINILANDGISNLGKILLKNNGFKIDTEHIPQESLIEKINANNYEVLLVRSATKVRKELIDS